MEYLCTPLLQFFGVGVSEIVVAISCVLAWVVPLPLFIKAGKQDKQTHEIDGVVLLAIGLVSTLHCLLFIGLLATAAMGVVMYFCFRKKEIPIFGQADFILLGHWLSSSFCYDTGEGLMIVESFIFLIALGVYTQTYRDKDGNPWERGKMVPLFPPYTTTVVIMVFLSIPVGILCYYWGF